MQLTCKLSHTLTAFEMTFEGIQYLVVEKALLTHLYEAAPPMALTPLRKKGRPRQTNPGLPVAEVPPPVARSKPAPMQDAIKAEIAKRGPLTSAELGQILGADKMPSIYTALYTMRKNHEITTQPDENGIRKNTLTKKRAASA